jgi:thiol-disulfide isomerase/thioredoxin
VGERAPDCSLVPIGTPDDPIDLHDLAGRVVWIDFWTTWCGACTESFPLFDRVQRELGDRGLVVIGVNLDVERGRAQEFLATHPVGFMQAVDSAELGDCARAFDVAGMPTSYLVDAKGIVRRVHRGFRRGEIDSTRRMLDELLPTPKGGRPSRQ